jgi:hypothetical protein
MLRMGLEFTIPVLERAKMVSRLRPPRGHRDLRRSFYVNKTEFTIDSVPTWAFVEDKGESCARV